LLQQRHRAPVADRRVLARVGLHLGAVQRGHHIEYD
jgi:hypothetical protein